MTHKPGPRAIDARETGGHDADVLTTSSPSLGRREADTARPPAAHCSGCGDELDEIDIEVGTGKCWLCEPVWSPTEGE